MVTDVVACDPHRRLTMTFDDRPNVMRAGPLVADSASITTATAPGWNVITAVYGRDGGRCTSVVTSPQCPLQAIASVAGDGKVGESGDGDPCRSRVLGGASKAVVHKNRGEIARA
jgi:hypothetical protein